MTVSYSGNLRQLIFRWKGSIWRSVYRELLFFLALYYAVRVFYTQLIPYFDPDEEKMYKKSFEALAVTFDEYTKRIPLTFLLGFYVANVVTRWWRQFECLSWPEDLLSLLCLVIPGTDDESQRNRHRIARYLNLSSVLALRDVSSKVRSRFPSLRHVVEFGLMTETESRLLNRLNDKSPGTRWLTPLHWIQQMLTEVFESKDTPPGHVTSMNNELKHIRENYRRLFCYDWVCVPLVYTQVAALATYSFFFFCLIGRQFIIRDENSIDLYFPVFSVVQFIFFVGWYKVGQDLMRPFGMDDDDIELNYILDRNLVSSFTIVNTLQQSDPPAFEEDAFWHRRFKLGLDLSRKAHEHPPKLHTAVDLKSIHRQYTDRDPLVTKEEENERFITW